ncbi:hypothetical protein [Sphingobacterium mizutaii]|uniref:hypothetical protein n=1 Tax=Sphingobacterium mizutaii TaxID=1010 RepID=UPI0016236DBE|nr:hypothetical protein [Sphingobacterium mizutaii]
MREPAQGAVLMRKGFANWNYMIIGARGAFHYNSISSVPKLYVYGGEMVRYFSDGE